MRSKLKHGEHEATKRPPKAYREPSKDLPKQPLPPFFLLLVSEGLPVTSRHSPTQKKRETEGEKGCLWRVLGWFLGPFWRLLVSSLGGTNSQFGQNQFCCHCLRGSHPHFILGIFATKGCILANTSPASQPVIILSSNYSLDSALCGPKLSLIPRKILLPIL